MNKQTLALEVENLKKSFKNKVAIESINFRVKKGEIFGILGANGAGKSTILSIITGLVKPDCGEIIVFGLNTKSYHVQTMSKMGVLVEAPGFYHHLTAIENLKIFGRVKGATETEAITALEQVGLNEHRKRRIREFSLGMKRRLGLAIALLNRPDLLILDEPTNGLDPIGTKSILSLILSLSKNDRKSIVLSSNILFDLEETCDRVLLINNGSQVLCEPLEEIIKPSEYVFELKVEPAEAAIDFLNRLPDVSVFETNNTKNCKIKSVRYSSSEINKLLVKAGYEVSEINPNRKTLQDLFLELNMK